MILDLQRFIEGERPGWKELEKILDHLETEPEARLGLDELQRFHELYERAAASLAKLTTFSSEPETRRYLETLSRGLTARFRKPGRNSGASFR